MRVFISILLVLFVVGCTSENKKEEIKKEPIKSVIKKEKEIKKEVVLESKKTQIKEIVKTKDGESLYASCSACHGKKGEKKALGKSAVIQAWSADKTIKALNGYKNSTYGGALKAMMKGQVSKLSDEDIKALSEYIEGL